MLEKILALGNGAEMRQFYWRNKKAIYEVKGCVCILMGNMRIQKVQQLASNYKNTE